VRLFVGNLPYDTTEAELREYLSAVGQLTSVYLPINRETGKPRGFAFVEFSQSEQAQEAISRFNNQPFKGRNLAISEARARESRPGDEGRPRDTRPREPRPFMGSGVGFSRPPRLERAAPPPDLDGARGSRASRSPDRRRGRKQPEAAARGERGPKRPIREKPGGRIYEDFDDDYVGQEEPLEDDFSRHTEEQIEEDEP
jgi:RNA recognition motif-containing protein